MNAGRKKDPICKTSFPTAYPGRYYAVLRNTRVIPAIFESELERVTCGYELKELDQRVERPKNMLKT